MRQRSALKALLLGSLSVGAASSLAVLASCTDYTTGQDPEPPGPLLVTRLTLLDPNGRDGNLIFTDTSAPLDCSLDSLKNTPACVNNPFKDRFSPKMSPPTPDSGTKMRVVFNKIPLKLNGQDIEKTPANGLPTDVSQLQLVDQTAVQLSCDSCTGAPMSYNTLQVTGSDLSPDPTTFDYGPALQLEVLPSYDPSRGTNIPDDPLRALEPSTVYYIKPQTGLSGRNPADLLQYDDRAKAILTFSTEPFQVIRSGIGDSHDPYVVNSCNRGSGATTDPFMAASAKTDDSGMCVYTDPQNDGVLALYLNAGVDYNAFQPSTATATVSIDGGAAMPVTGGVLLTNGIKGMNGCDRGSQRTLYIAPKGGTWVPGLAAGSTAVVTVTVRGTDVRDVSQAAGHPANMGRHVLSGDIVLKATIQSSNMAPKAAKAADVLACP